MNQFLKSFGPLISSLLLLCLVVTGDTLAQNPAQAGSDAGLHEPLNAKVDTLYYIGDKPGKGDTAQYIDRYIDIFSKFNWNVTIIDKNGVHQKYVSKRPDTLFNSNGLDTVYFSASFAVAPQLLNQVFALQYRLEGSLSVQLNDQTILTTGRFQKERSDKLSRLSQNDFKNFIFKDTLQKLYVIYLPRPETKMYDIKYLNICQPPYADEKKTDIVNGFKRSCSMGFYYLAFGIVFIILFTFFREKTENLYFALFCIFASLAFLWDNFQADILYNLSPFWSIFCFEFLSIFLCKILKNKEKSKIPLLVIALIMAVCFLPVIRYNYFIVFGSAAPLILTLIFILLYVYTCASSFYFLINGIGQKQWEAKTILIFCFSPVLLLVVCYILLSLYLELTGVNEAKSLRFVMFFGYFIQMIAYIYPLAAVFILGKRNGLNQKQLIAQVASIKQLSDVNLAKEQEKKLILENQKELLEREVALQTMEVVAQKEKIEKQHDELKIEKRKSDDLLLNILPAEVAEELKDKGSAAAKQFDEVTVLFTDFVNFTSAGESMSPQALLEELNTCFKAFDDITIKYSVEKIKTIGDAYLAVAGLPAPDPLHATHVVQAAMDINAFMQDRRAKLGDKTFDIRIGIHSGSVVAGIVGIKKFAYDIWGDTVNTAARMEQNSKPGKINISETTYELVKDKFDCEYRGEIEAKGKGQLKMYFAS